ncbi:hypothetical protein GCK32_012953 [Trichostrongylus colubriformis]|uniref:Uncharacterized protein n=1 Tax=Trichostrongylus colubriformis TaxID=6319 RepID=A0AAN8G243_TRICO
MIETARTTEITELKESSVMQSPSECMFLERCLRKKATLGQKALAGAAKAAFKAGSGVKSLTKKLKKKKSSKKSKKNLSAALPVLLLAIKWMMNFRDGFLLLSSHWGMPVNVK